MTELETLVPAADPAVERLALVLHDSFVAYHDAYLEVTHRAANRFLNREWDEHQDDNTERLGLHKKGVWSAVDATRLICPTTPRPPADSGSMLGAAMSPSSAAGWISSSPRRSTTR